MSEPAEHQSIFPELGSFDIKAGLRTQFRIAEMLASMITPEKIDRNHLRPIIIRLNTDLPTVIEFDANQEHLVRESTERLISMVALITSGGDANKARELLGVDNFDKFGYIKRGNQYVNFVEATQELIQERRNEEPSNIVASSNA